ncbi:hypothetical protein AVEN_40536-1 [Araneus ventricosus]|uniref:Uncharacterized protein n=1 Tax=Araneus ventricosus TaxID=182803 RepID=A0A4Y2UWY5_ARAVE|nr:hypothetical protein AVEN_40536-1 [Araneus ventricosus]
MATLHRMRMFQTEPPRRKSLKHSFKSYTNSSPDYRNNYNRTHKASPRERGPPKKQREFTDIHSKSTNISSGNPSKLPSVYYDQQSSNNPSDKLNIPKQTTPVQVSIQRHRQKHNLPSTADLQYHSKSLTITAPLPQTDQHTSQESTPTKAPTENIEHFHQLQISDESILLENLQNIHSQISFNSTTYAVSNSINLPIVKIVLDSSQDKIIPFLERKTSDIERAITESSILEGHKVENQEAGVSSPKFENQVNHFPLHRSNSDSSLHPFSTGQLDKEIVHRLIFSTR